MFVNELATQNAEIHVGILILTSTLGSEMCSFFLLIAYFTQQQI